MVSAIEKYYRTIELVLTGVLFVFAVAYDSMHFPRMYTFIFGFAGYSGLILFRKRRLSQLQGVISYLLSIGCILLLEANSRYIINYFIHVLYILLMIELAVSLNNKKELWIGGLIIVGGMYKYVTLIQYKSAISTYAEASFFLMINLMSVFVITLMQGLREEQDKLIQANVKLEAYSEEVQALTEIKTRANIASSIHDGVGHNLTALIMQLEMTGHLLDTNTEMAKEHLEAAKETARDNLVQIRKAVKAMDTSSEKYDFNHLIQRFSVQTGIKISWEIDKNISLSIEQRECIYRSLQEGLTNAVRHGYADRVGIKIDQKDSIHGGQVQISIHDNGKAVNTPITGYGLSKMIERYERLGGAVEFHIENGLLIKATLPIDMEDSNND